MVESLKAGDREALVEATMLQGILSGDVIAASIAARARLQREHLQLRRRLAYSRIKTESAKQRLLDVEVEVRTRPQPDLRTMVNRMREIYGLPPIPSPLLPEVAAEIVSETLPVPGESEQA